MAPYQHPGMTLTELERLLTLAYPQVFARVARRFRDEQLAEEVSRDALSWAYEVWHADPDYFVRHDLTGRVGQRATWRAIDHLRQRNRIRPLPDGWGQEEEHAVRPRRTADPDSLARDRELTWECLQRLSEEDRRILEERYYEGRTDQEIGDELYGPCGDSQANNLRVWRRRQRAYKRLRMLLLESGIDPSDWNAAQAV